MASAASTRRVLWTLTRLLGGVLLLGGLGHVAGVSARFAATGVPAPERVALLAHIALVQLGGGALLLLGGRGVQGEERRARWVVLITALWIAAWAATDLGVVWSNAGVRAIVLLYLGLALAIASLAALRCAH